MRTRSKHPVKPEPSTRRRRTTVLCGNRARRQPDGWTDAAAQGQAQRDGRQDEEGDGEGAHRSQEEGGLRSAWRGERRALPSPGRANYLVLPWITTLPPP